jgi:hypothetical protein
MEEKERNIPAHIQEIGVETQNGGSHLLDYNGELDGIHGQR